MFSLTPPLGHIIHVHCSLLQSIYLGCNLLKFYMISIYFLYLAISSMRTDHGFVSLPQYLQILRIVLPELLVVAHQIFIELNAYTYLK